MKKHIRKFTNFSKRIGKGLHVEFKETVEIPKLIKNRKYKKAGSQVADIFKMAGITIVWIVPGGTVLIAIILKFSYKARPSAFRKSSVENLEDPLSQSNNDSKKDLGSIEGLNNNFYDEKNPPN